MEEYAGQKQEPEVNDIAKDANREHEVGHGMNVNEVDDEQSQQTKCGDRYKYLKEYL